MKNLYPEEILDKAAEADKGIKLSFDTRSEALAFRLLLYRTRTRNAEALQTETGWEDLMIKGPRKGDNKLWIGQRTKASYGLKSLKILSAALLLLCGLGVGMAGAVGNTATPSCPPSSQWPEARENLIRENQPGIKYHNIISPEDIVIEGLETSGLDELVLFYKPNPEKIVLLIAIEKGCVVWYAEVPYILIRGH